MIAHPLYRLHRNAFGRLEFSGPNGEAHADNAVPDGALGAFLAGKPAEREDE